ncbi:unnamed protein product [Adineta steineri]|uniref:DUF4590 domain-containing protein n=1 Tax=Adineta steineri TaxID=433720 RepID=A0A819UDG5_9BILA|nr:unnamed protein product [Adineta steineri]
MSDLKQNSPMFNKYFQDRRIRRYLITAGLINRHGDIIPPTSEQIARARRITQQRIADNSTKQDDDDDEEEQSRNETNRSPRRSRKEKTKNSKPIRRGVSRNLSSIRRSPISTDRKRSPNRAKSAHQRSQDFSRYFINNSARAKSPTKERCRVTMMYYGPQTNFDYDNCWFLPHGDEITVSQQHCGGENLIVFKGHVKPNERFAFDSRRHPDYPFALALYVNGVAKSRISVCCEYKHKRNIPLDGKNGLFGICDVKKVTPCESCQLRQRKKQLQSNNDSFEAKSSRNQKPIVPRVSSERRSSSSSKKQKPDSSRNLVVFKHHSPEISRTPTPPSKEKKVKRPVLPTQIVQDDSIKYAHHPVASQSNDNDESYTSDFDESNDNDLPTLNDRYGRPRISESNSIDDQRRSHNSSRNSRKLGFSDDDDDDDRKTPVPLERNHTFDRSTKSSSTMPKKLDSSEDEDNNRPFKIMTGKDKTNSRRRQSPPSIHRKSDPSDDDDDRRTPVPLERNHTFDRSTKISSTMPKKLDSSGDEDNNRPSKIMTGKNNTINHTRQSPPSIHRRSDLSNDEDDHHTSSGRNNNRGHSKKSPPTIQRKSDPSDDENDHRTPIGRNNSRGYSRKSPTITPIKFDSSEDEDNKRFITTVTEKTNNLRQARQLPSTTIQRKSDSPENDNQLSHRKNNNYNHSEDENDHYIPKTSTDRKNITESPQSPLSDASRKSNENNNRFLSTKTTDHETDGRRPFSSSINRNHKESPVRRTSASSSEVPNDTHKNNFDSTFDTKSWFTDESSDQK